MFQWQRIVPRLKFTGNQTTSKKCRNVDFNLWKCQMRSTKWDYNVKVGFSTEISIFISGWILLCQYRMCLCMAMEIRLWLRNGWRKLGSGVESFIWINVKMKMEPKSLRKSNRTDLWDTLYYRIAIAMSGLQNNEPSSAEWCESVKRNTWVLKMIHMDTKQHLVIPISQIS